MRQRLRVFGLQLNAVARQEGADAILVGLSLEMIVSLRFCSQVDVAYIVVEGKRAPQRGPPAGRRRGLRLLLDGGAEAIALSFIEILCQRRVPCGAVAIGFA